MFGGGHVVLPLLKSEVVRPGRVSPDAFPDGTIQVTGDGGVEVAAHIDGIG